MELASNISTPVRQDRGIDASKSRSHNTKTGRKNIAKGDDRARASDSGCRLASSHASGSLLKVPTLSRGADGATWCS